MPIKRVDFNVLAFIRSLNENQFTISYLNKAYIESPECQHTCPKISRQYLYRNLLKYLEQGVLVSCESKTSKAVLYSIAESLETNIVKTSIKNDSDSISCVPDTKEICDSIREKLKIHKLTLLKTMGETEAFKEWAEERPDLRADIQDRYNSVRDESAKLLGKVNAYESLLTMYEGS
tara:strand:+ start:4347 stop:4877 length:531 start_codon:yes stop_codon:yes gene_type:complete